jgi:hypothetical protein
MKNLINTFKSKKINFKDIFNFNNKQVVLNLEDKNALSRDMILMYIYYLPNLPLHGYKVGMTICRLGETPWLAIKSRVDKQDYEVALDSDSVLQERYLKYGLDREVLFWGVCIDDKDDNFKDHHIHREIVSQLPGYTEKKQEWFTGDITFEDIIAIFEDYRNSDFGSKKEIFEPRKEQKKAISDIKSYFGTNPPQARFLLNCKMRFGKCFTTYKYAEENNINKILILTFVPAVEENWQSDLKHIKKDYKYFIDADLRNDSFSLKQFDKDSFVVFLSLQNYLGKDGSTKETKEKIAKLQQVNFDLVVLDEYHFGAWNDRTQETIEGMDKTYQDNLKKLENLDVTKRFGIKTKQTLCLSGTPFKAIDKGEFNESNSSTYSYFDEQKNKYPDGDMDNPSKDYTHFPDMRIFGYNMDSLFGGLEKKLQSSDKILNRQYFSLNKFFETEKDSDNKNKVKFVYEEEIKNWFNILRGGLHQPGVYFPYQHPHLENNKHSLWLMPTINACEALAKLLDEDDYFSQFGIINLSSQEVGSGKAAKRHLDVEMTKAKQLNKLGTISITVNKLTLGVTVKPWASVFVLKDLASPEQYFQSIFRVQTPYTDENGKILKKQGNVYDFNIDRASALLLHYAEKSGNTTKLDIPKLIVKYLPIYVNGDISAPISEEVFYELASFGYSGKSLSQRIRDIERTTRALDDQTIAAMMNDPDCSEVIKRVFAHAKFDKPKTKTPPADPNNGFKSPETVKGRKIGYEKGLLDYKLYIEIEDSAVQDLFVSNAQKIFKETCSAEYNENQKKYFFNGIIAGYESGVNVPIKKMKCGHEDGIKFVEEVKKKFGKNVVYVKDTKDLIRNFIHQYLNIIDNIPKQFQGKLMIRWYKESFRDAVVQTLKPVITDKENSVEDTQNVLKHILAKVFQFLYISVYRETKFKDVFANADPYVFHSAVGIKKEEFEILNKYQIFQERVLDAYIHEFFVNESLGKKFDENDENFKQNYRNSFNWFGFGIENTKDPK